MNAGLHQERQYYPQIAQINADLHAVIRDDCITQKMSQIIGVMVCLIGVNLRNLRTTAFSRLNSKIARV
jgi:hypothetical protein